MGERSRILAIACLRDEGPNLLHWIAHNRGIGISDFLLFTNDCTDGTDDLLDLLAAHGVAAHVRNLVAEGKSPQWSALRMARDHPLQQVADWILHLDCDEYPNIRPPSGSLLDLIERAQADAIVLPWRLFGHNGHVRRPLGPPTRAFTRAIPEDALYPAAARFVKTLYKRSEFDGPGVHRPLGGEGACWVDGSGRALSREFVQSRQIMLWGDTLATDLVQLNHYSVRSVEEFFAKILRGLPNHTGKPVDLNYWVERNFNTVEDTSILKHEEKTEAELVGLRALPHVAEAETRAVSHHRRAFEAALVDPETVKLFGRLILAAGSAPPDRRLAETLVRLFQEATAS